MTYAKLNSANAISGQVHLLTISTSTISGRIERWTQRFDDDAGDYGDAYNPGERALLAAGQPVCRESHGWKTETRCMITATLKGA